jgi:hypothetical protein
MYSTSRTEAVAVKSASNDTYDQADAGYVNNHWRMPITVYSYVKAETWAHQFAAQIAARPVHLSTGRKYPVNLVNLIEFRDSLGVVAWMPAANANFSCTP